MDVVVRRRTGQLCCSLTHSANLTAGLCLTPHSFRRCIRSARSRANTYGDVVVLGSVVGF